MQNAKCQNNIVKLRLKLNCLFPFNALFVILHVLDSSIPYSGSRLAAMISHITSIEWNAFRYIPSSQCSNSFLQWLRIVYWKCLHSCYCHWLNSITSWWRYVVLNENFSHQNDYVICDVARYFLCTSFYWLHFQEHSKLEFRQNQKLKNIYIVLC